MQTENRDLRDRIEILESIAGYQPPADFDSLDWLDNYSLDGTITIDAATYPEAAHWLGADISGVVAARP